MSFTVIENKKDIEKSIEEYKTKNDIKDPSLKGFRAGMGVYEQRQKGTFMARPRIPAGVITLEQLEAVSRIADRYSNGILHFTTRQDVQFHGLTFENSGKVMDELLKVGLATKGTGGNTARNVGCSPLSGVSEDEVFDVTEYALQTTKFLLRDPSTLTLPRKYKIAYSNSNADTANSSISDLGFIATVKYGRKGFILYGAGGLGGGASASIKLEDFIEAKDALYYVQAMKELFEREGDRTNRSKARIRFIVKRLGEEKFLELYKEILEKVKAEKKLDLFVEEKTEVKGEGRKVKSRNRLIIPQKDKGWYSLYIHPISGYLKTADLNKVIDYLKGLNYKTSIRLTNTQGFFVRDLKGDAADELLKVIRKFAALNYIESSIACTGASTCQLGLCASGGLLKAVVNRFKREKANVKKALPRIFISGCPNSCGQHQKGEIGLTGKAIRTEDGMVPAYTVSFNGRVASSGARLGEAAGEIPAKKVPDFLVRLAILKEDSGVKSFEKFIGEKKAEIEKLFEEFKGIETEAENSTLYYDFGYNTKFLSKNV